MPIKSMADNNINITSAEDAAHYYAMSGMQPDAVIPDVYQELEVTQAGGLMISLAAGQAHMQGRHITASGINQVEVPPSQVSTIVIRVDLSAPAGAEAELLAVTAVQSDDLLNNGSVRDLVLATVISSASAITTLTDTRTYTHNYDYIANSSVTTAKIANNAVTSAKIADGAITRAKTQRWEVAGMNTIAMGGVIGNTYSANISFGVTFRSIPAVVGSAIGYPDAVFFRNITTTGCTVYKAKSSVDDVNTDINWIAREKGI